MEKTEMTVQAMPEIDVKYNFHYNQKTGMVICTTVYKGKTIRGVAKCSPEDTFDTTVGEKLAYLRCRYKLAKKKTSRAAAVYAKAWIESKKAEKRLQHAIDFVEDTTCELTQIRNELAHLESDLEA